MTGEMNGLPVQTNIKRLASCHCSKNSLGSRRPLVTECPGGGCALSCARMLRIPRFHCDAVFGRRGGTARGRRERGGLSLLRPPPPATAVFVLYLKSQFLREGVVLLMCCDMDSLRTPKVF